MKKIFIITILISIYNSCFSQNSDELLHEKFMFNTEYCKNMAEKGNAVAQNALGTQFDLAENYSEALIWYNKSALQGNAMACYNIGCCYFYGYGVQENNQSAVSWFKKAIERQGCWVRDNAFQKIGYCYFYEGPIQNYSEAFLWFKKATIENEKDYDSKYMLAWMIENGKGVKKNMTSAAKIYIDASKQNYDAMLSAARCYYNGLGIVQNYPEAVQLWKKVASIQYGHKAQIAEAQYNLSNCYSKGHGVTRNQQTADSYLKFSAENGYMDAIEDISAKKAAPHFGL